MRDDQCRLLVIAILAAPQLDDRRTYSDSTQAQAATILRDFDPHTGKPFSTEQKLARARNKASQILLGTIWCADRLIALSSMTDEEREVEGGPF